MPLLEFRSRETLVSFFEENFGEDQLWKQKEDDLELIVKLITIIRPKNPAKNKIVDLYELIYILEKKSIYKESLAEYIKKVLKDKRFNTILSDAGILQDADFFREVKKRFFAKFIPDQPQKNTLEYVLNQIFFINTDPIWLDKIPSDQVMNLFQLLNFNTIYVSKVPYSPLSELFFGMGVLSYRICGRAMESEVIKMVPEYQSFESPFLAFQRELVLMGEKLIESEQNFISSEDLGYKQLLILHKQCMDYVTTAFNNSEKYGISLRVNQNLLRIRQQLMRLESLIPLLILDNEDDAIKNTIQLSYSLVDYNCDKNNIRKLINESTQLLSYEVTQHTAKTGEHYITENRSEYFKMFRTAAGGGFIVSILCIIKLLLGKVGASDFGHAFIYSMNYSIGFIVIYILGFTLATKQPAMTASALVRALQDGIKKQGQAKEDKHKAFAVFFARVFRSQFIAFVGNVLVAFPIALLAIWLIDIGFGNNIAKQKWTVLMNDISPIASPAIFHSAIAGVFLFLSGIIAGSISNRDKHNHIYYRIQEHPLLKLSLGKKVTKKIADLYEKKWAGIVSNFWFGVFMGSTASIGIFLGLNLDIRHITFASGNLALGLYGADFNVSNAMLFWGIFGIGIIGLVNFMISFGLSLGLAFRSRNIPLSELNFVIVSIWQHFKEKPRDFFFPLKKKSSRVVES